MNILVTGANGQLGTEMRIIARNSKENFIFTDVTKSERYETRYLDITDLDAVREIVNEKSIDAIVNCAAYTDVDGAENNVILAQRINEYAPENLAIAMKEVDGFLIHISTDYVFGGNVYNAPCTEDLECNPLGVYGQTKLRGEEKIIESGCKYVIIRTAWLYSEFGKNFLKTMMHLTSTQTRVKVVFDQVGSPTYALDLARAIEVVLQKFDGSQVGIYHYSNEGVCSWYDFTKTIQANSGILGCRIEPCHSEDYPSLVKRPSYSVLDKTKIKEVFDVEVPYWVTSLKTCIKSIKLFSLYK